MKETLILTLLLSIFACNHQETTEQEPITESPDSNLVKTVALKPDTIPFSLDYLMGHFDPAKHEDFLEIDPKYADRPGRYLRKDTYAAFLEMYEAALKDTVELKIISATRNFANQKRIWESKWNGQRKLEGKEVAPEVYPKAKDRALAILRYSSMPGTSRHHWGTDIDLNNLTNKYFDKGKGKRIYDWLNAHAAEYGFCQTYTPKGEERPDGYNEERWHWSYMPIAKQLTQLAQQSLQDSLIQGFDGAEAAIEIEVVKKYVLGINKDCLP